MAAIWRSEKVGDMNHEVILEGFGCKLRPASLDDSQFIVELRNMDFAKGNINRTSTDVERQKEWMRKYLARPDDYYWLISPANGEGRPVGTIGLYDFTPDRREAMPGRWVMMNQTSFNVMAPIFLVYRFAFESLGVDRLVMDVVSDNRKVRRFHELYGARPMACPERYRQETQASGLDLAWYELPAADWPAMKACWQPILETF